MTKYERTCYTRRNAAALLATHLVEQAAISSVPWTPTTPGERYEKGLQKARARVERAVSTSSWMSGFHIDLSNLTKREEREVLEGLQFLLGKARLTVHRAHGERPRYIEISL